PTSGKHRYHYPRTLNQAATQGGGTSLEQLGFVIGTKLRITASEGQLLMEVLPPVEVPAKARSVRR
ncbi:hypothetical protein ABQ129_14250, partial [Xanthomonas sp. WHRI 8370]